MNEMNPQRIDSDWIADSNFIGYESANVTSIRLNFKISSVDAMCLNLKILLLSVMNPNKFTLV